MVPSLPQTESTYALACRAIAGGDAPEAVRRIRQLLDEAAEGRELFPLFIDRARAFLLDRGVPAAAVSAEEQRILSLLGATGDTGASRKGAAPPELTSQGEPEGRGAWTEERGTSEEGEGGWGGGWGLKSAPQAHENTERASREGGASEAPQRRAGDTDALEMRRQWEVVAGLAARAQEACLAGDG